jgi:hypothetical protein
MGLTGRHHSEDLGINGKITLKFILGKSGRRVWIGFMWLRIKSSSGIL